MPLCFYVQPAILIKVFRLIKLINVGEKEELYCLTSKGNNNLHMAKCWIRLKWIAKEKRILPKNEGSVGVCMGGKRRRVKRVSFIALQALTLNTSTWLIPGIACAGIFLNY